MAPLTRMARHNKASLVDSVSATVWQPRCLHDNSPGVERRVVLPVGRRGRMQAADGIRIRGKGSDAAVLAVKKSSLITGSGFSLRHQILALPSPRATHSFAPEAIKCLISRGHDRISTSNSPLWDARGRTPDVACSSFSLFGMIVASPPCCGYTGNF
jgi:hypothetical protein